MRCLLHPTYECHWVVFQGNGQVWVVAMTLDEAMRHEEPGGVVAAMTRNKKSCADCTRADVWRACTPAHAYGRLLTPVADQEEATAPSSTKPAEVEQTEPVKPADPTAEEQSAAAK